MHIYGSFVSEHQLLYDDYTVPEKHEVTTASFLQTPHHSILLFLFVYL